jgi:uncharacterized protein YccT (UPF0319 family)
MNKGIFFALGFIALLAAGCSSTSVHQMYEGPKRPTSETATLIVPFTIDLLELDGEKFESSPLLSSAKETRLELLPGEHVVVARYSSPYEEPQRAERPAWKTSPQQFTFNAEAGKIYRFDVDLPGTRGADGTTIRDATIQIVMDASDRSVPPTAVAQAQVPPPEPKKKSKDSQALKNLKKAWFDATEEEQEQFLKWTEDNR